MTDLCQHCGARILRAIDTAGRIVDVERQTDVTGDFWLFEDSGQLFLRRSGEGLPTARAHICTLAHDSVIDHETRIQLAMQIADRLAPPNRKGPQTRWAESIRTLSAEVKRLRRVCAGHKA